MREAKFDKGLKEIGNFENLYVARLVTKLVDKNDGREKDDRKEGDKGTVS